MADAAKVPGKAAEAAKDSVKDTVETVEETVTEKVAPTVRGRFAAFRSDPDVKDLEGKMKPALQAGVLWTAAAIVAPEITAAAAAYQAVQRYRSRDKASPEDTNANA